MLWLTIFPTEIFQLMWISDCITEFQCKYFEQLCQSIQIYIFQARNEIKFACRMEMMLDSICLNNIFSLIFNQLDSIAS